MVEVTGDIPCRPVAALNPHDGSREKRDAPGKTGAAADHTNHPCRGVELFRPAGKPGGYHSSFTWLPGNLAVPGRHVFRHDHHLRGESPSGSGAPLGD
jgi:hypothetical protein